MWWWLTFRIDLVDTGGQYWHRHGQDGPALVTGMSDANFVVTFTEPHELTDENATELPVADYDDFGSMYTLELVDGSTRSVGKQLVETVTDID